jgi:hypothetical protein
LPVLPQALSHAAPELHAIRVSQIVPPGRVLPCSVRIQLLNSSWSDSTQLVLRQRVSCCALKRAAGLLQTSVRLHG